MQKGDAYAKHLYARVKSNGVPISGSNRPEIKRVGRTHDRYFLIADGPQSCDVWDRHTGKILYANVTVSVGQKLVAAFLRVR